MGRVILESIDREELIENVAAAVVDLLKQGSEIDVKTRQPLLVGADDLADRIGVSRSTVDRLVKAKSIPSKLVGRCRLFDPAAVVDALPNDGGQQ